MHFIGACRLLITQPDSVVANDRDARRGENFRREDNAHSVGKYKQFPGLSDKIWVSPLGWASEYGRRHPWQCSLEMLPHRLLLHKPPLNSTYEKYL